MGYPTGRIQLYDRNMKPLRELAPSEVTSRVRREELNGEHELTITTTRRLEEGWRALTVDDTGKWYEWVVVETPEEHSDGGSAVGTYRLVWSLQYDLTHSYSHTHSEVGYGDCVKTASGAAALVLEDVDRWEVGTCDGANIEAGKGCVFIFESAWSRLSKVVEVTGWEADAVIEVSDLFAVTARKLCLRAHVGNESATGAYDNNMLRNTASPSSNDVLLIRSELRSNGIIRLASTTYDSHLRWTTSYLKYKDCENQTYVISFDARLANTTSAYTANRVRVAALAYDIMRSGAEVSSTYDCLSEYKEFLGLTSEWQRFSYVVRVPQDMTEGNRSALKSDSLFSVTIQTPARSVPIDVRCVKLERGSIPTPWVRPISSSGAVSNVRRFDWGSDVTSIKRTPDPGPYYCRVVPLGKGTTEYAEDDETTFEWPIDITEEEPNGRYYIEDIEAADAFRISDGNGGWVYPTIAVSYNQEDPELLYQEALNDVYNHTRPGITYEANVVQFARAGMNVHGVSLGDDVHIVDRGFNPDSGLRLQGRVTAIEVDELSPETGTDLTIGNIRDNMANTFADMRRSLGNLAFQNTRITNSLHDMSTVQYIDELLQRINAEINATGGYSYLVKGEGLITYDAAVDDPLDGHEAGKVVQIKGGSIRIADSKKSTFQGIDDWNWTTVFTADGVNADLVTAAKITAGYIGNANSGNYWDLDNNYLTVGQGIINAGLIHGGTLTLGGDDNTNGLLQVLDENGTVIGQLDNTGATIVGMLTLITDGYRARSKHYTKMGTYQVSNVPSSMAGTIHGLKIYTSGEQVDNTVSLTCDASYSHTTPMAMLASEKDLVLYSYLSSAYSGMAVELTNGHVRIGYKQFSSGDYHTMYIADFLAGDVWLGADVSIDNDLSVTGDASFGDDVSLNGDLWARGTKSRSVETDDYGNRLLYAYETPTPMFGDLGSARTDENGYAYVSIDDIFSETARTDISYQVFLQKRGQGDLWVSEKHRTHFVVQGTPSIAFDWEIKCVQRDYEMLRLESNDIKMSTDKETARTFVDAVEAAYTDEYGFVASIEGLYEDEFAA